jgi:hypothetical protein
MLEHLAILANPQLDIAAIRDWLDARADVCEDPHAHNTYFICGSPEMAAFVAERRSISPHRAPRACVVSLVPAGVALDQTRSDLTAIRSSIDFLNWLVARFACRVQIGDALDATGAVRRDGAASLYSARVRAAALPWQHRLIGVGFYHELAHGSPIGPSLELARQATPSPDEPRLARYLAAGQLYRRVVDPPTPAFDWFDRDLAIGPPHLLTDGVHVWPADLAHYVRTYHVPLPRSFLVHARRNIWRVPAVDIASLPAFEV